MNTSRSHCKLTLWTVLFTLFVSATAHAQGKIKSESFDRDPGWEGVNNRSARDAQPAVIRQEFGYSKTNHAGGKKAGEVGGFITGAGEVSYYGKVIQGKTFNDPLSASGTFASADEGYHLLLGFFNANSTNEWRTPNTISIRVNGRGDHFYAYVEYCTSKWRRGGDTTPFLRRKDPQTGALVGFACAGKPHKWLITYDPDGNSGKGAVTATIDDQTAVCTLDEGHKLDGATFNRFGIMNVVKSADGGGEVWLDDIAINAQAEFFDEDPKWEGKNNRKTWESTIIRPLFDFGFAPTHFAGKANGELGGRVFRGDCRYPDRMACYGDRIGPLTLAKPFKASGKIAMTRGLSDSTTLFGFYNSAASMQQSDSQSDSVPESVVGVHIEGPSSEGFRFYPVCRTKGTASQYGRTGFPRIFPDRASHDWSLEYNPDAAGGKGQMVITLDGRLGTLDLEEGAKSLGTQLDRFGIITSWIDGNSQNVYWDDIIYTTSQE